MKHHCNGSSSCGFLGKMSTICSWLLDIDLDSLVGVEHIVITFPITLSGSSAVWISPMFLMLLLLPAISVTSMPSMGSS